MKHIVAPIPYGKREHVDYCIACHQFGAERAGPKLADIIHASHYNNEFNGNCFSCHAINTKGAFVLFDDVKYDATFGGFVVPNVDATIEWVKKRGFPTGHMIGFDMDKDMQGTMSLSQDVVTELKDVFGLVNFELPQIERDSHTLTVKGMVEAEATYTLADLQRKPQTEVAVTKTCLTNPIGGAYIANLQFSGVAFDSILQEVGVRPGANVVKFTGADGWHRTSSLDLLKKRGAILAMAVNGEDLPAELGDPVVLVIPREGGATWVKWVDTVEILEVPEDRIPPASKDYTDRLVKVNSGFLVPPRDGTEVEGPVRLEGWAYSWGQEPIKAVLLSGDYGKNWRTFEVPEPVDPHRWVYWKFEWDPPASGRYLLKVKSVTTGGKEQPKEDNLVLVVK